MTQLLRQSDTGALDPINMRALVEEASQSGAHRALASLGLDDDNARRDMDELRQLLSAWRDAKRSAWQAVVAWAVRIFLACVLIGLAVRLDLAGLIHAAR
ncbi:DUF6127 family protein [Sphingomonas sp. BN140010]|uniref:DUF6127 family protein n=2 Tax=Sphingomonas arvum TaxID=2992113 RepID=A0ABT3JHR8_9SPHN|nr:DUF6127 family protein [Sphingomonas sp. BN140010]